MTISSQTVSITYKPGSGSNAQSLAGLVFFDAAHLVVEHVAAATGVVTALTNGVGYSLSGSGALGTASITALFDYPADDEFIVRRQSPRVQPDAFASDERFPVETVEKRLDALALIDQEQDEDLARAIKAQRGEAGPVLDPLASLEGKALAYESGTVKGLDALTTIQAVADEVTEAAAGSATQTEASASSAALSASTAEAASGPNYASTAAGLAATSDGESFAVDNGDGTVTVYLNDGGSAVAQRTLATSAALAASGGAALIGKTGGGTVQGGLDERAVLVATRTALAALDTSSQTSAILGEAGREGLFLWRTGNLSSFVTNDPNEGVYVAPSSDDTGASGAWVRQHEGTIHAAWFGVVDDDGSETNQSAAVQAAVNFVSQYRLGTLLFGEMTVFCSNVAMKPDVVITGLSPQATYFKPASDAPVFIMTQTASAARFGWRNLTIDGDTTLESQSGIVIDPDGASGYFAESPFLDRVRIMNCGKRGLDLQGGTSTDAGFIQNLTITHCRIEDNMAAGVYAKGKVIESYGHSNLIVQNNRAEEDAGTAARADEGNMVLVRDGGTAAPGRWVWIEAAMAGRVVGTGETETSTVFYCEGQDVMLLGGNMEHGSIFAHVASSAARNIVIDGLRLASSSPMDSFFKVDAVKGMNIRNIAIATSADSSFDHIIDAPSQVAVFGLAHEGILVSGTARASAKAYNISNRLRINRNAVSQIDVTNGPGLYVVEHGTDAGATAAENGQVRTIKIAEDGSNQTDDIPTGFRVTLHAFDGATDAVTVKTAAGNIVLSGGDYVLDDILKSITLEYDGERGRFIEVSRA